jgi:hypothetical protein
VRFSPPSIKNDKSDRKKNRKYLANRSCVSTGPRNLELTREITPEKRIRSINWTRIGISGLNKKNRTIKEKRRVQPKKGQKEYYINRNDNIKQKNQSNIWMLMLRSKIRLIIPENSTEKYKGKLNSK